MPDLRPTTRRLILRDHVELARNDDDAEVAGEARQALEQLAARADT
jgi:hypothetical protein